jgi:hypothetical protein
MYAFTKGNRKEATMCTTRTVKVSQILILLTLISLTGCLSDLKWDRSIDFPAIQGAEGKKVIVTDFTKSLKHVTVTNSYDLEITQERLSAHDISCQVASGLEGEGIEAVAMVDYEPDLLRENELLLRGSIRANPWWSGVNGLHMFFSMFSAFIIGGILPYPLPAKVGADITYRVELIGPDGSILLQTGNQEVIGYYDKHWVYGEGKIMGRAAGIVDEPAAVLPEMITHALAKAIKGRV